MSKPKPTRAAVSQLQSHTGFWLRAVSNHVSHAFARKLLASRVTPAEWVVLREMYDREDMSPSLLADLAGMTRGAASKLIDRLVAKKLVSRRENAGDRRYQDIALTPAGRTLVPSLAAIADRNDQELFSRLTPAEHRALLTVLKKLVQVHGLRKSPIA
ncbi:MAG: MarR family transcriptional regulator [Candidatus Acidiferrales bacterium]